MDKEIILDILEAAKFHAVKVPVTYGDDTEDTDLMISLEELKHILFEVLENEDWWNAPYEQK